MSLTAICWAWAQRDLKSSAKFVLLCLADCHNDASGRCDPSVNFICDKTGLNRKTVYSCISYLDEIGVISVKIRPGSSTVYSLNLTQIWGDPKTGQPKIGLTQKRVTGCPKNGSGGDPKTGHEPVNNQEVTRNSNQEDEKQRIDFAGIQELWNEILGEHIGEVKAVTDQRKKHIRARVNEDGKRLSNDWWERYFRYVSSSDFLTGRGGPNPATGKPWKPNFDWMLNQTNMIKIIEGKYHSE